MPKKILEILSSFEEVEKLNSELKLIYQQSGMHPEDIIELEIIQVEALNNIVKHSYSGISGKKIKVELEVESKIWKMKLIDFGLPRKKLKVPELNFNPDKIESLPESGMGLFLINKLTNYNHYIPHLDKNEFYLLKILRYETVD